MFLACLMCKIHNSFNYRSLILFIFTFSCFEYVELYIESQIRDEKCKVLCIKKIMKIITHTFLCYIKFAAAKQKDFSSEKSGGRIIMSKKKMKYFLILFLCSAIITGVFSGCGTTAVSPGTSGSSGDSDNKIVKPVTYDPNSPTGGLTLPLMTDKSIKLTYWIPLNEQAKGMIQSYNDNAAIQELEKRTGVIVEFLHPPIGQEVEQYKLLISSNDLPDMIEERGTALYPGGGDKAIEDQAFIRLNELIEKYAPNYNHLRTSVEQIGKLTMTDAGNIWSFSMIQNFDALVLAGLIIRDDYLDDINMHHQQL